MSIITAHYVCTDNATIIKTIQGTSFRDAFSNALDEGQRMDKEFILQNLPQIKAFSVHIQFTEPQTRLTKDDIKS